MIEVILRSILKQAVAIWLIITLGIQTFSKLVIEFNFEINRSYIAKDLCINRNNPESTCKGKCYLKKKLAADEDQQQPASKNAVQKNLQQDLFLSEPMRINFSFAKDMILHASLYRFSDSQEFVKSIFEPPQFS
ncbi:MAG: hypothetical protein KGM16_12410 [Bacteroidota bacterium]|nr:hypothetical protein [Bacteroidota bacterium]